MKGWNWIPDILPSNVRIVVSVQPGDCLNALRKRGIKEIELKTLSKETCKAVIINTLIKYNKKLDENQLAALLNKEQSNVPLWLTRACEELRVFGVFDKLDDKIQSIDGQLSGLVEQSIARVIHDIMICGDLLHAVFSLIACSRFGLTEKELTELLVIEPTLPPNTKPDGGSDQIVRTSEHRPFIANTVSLPPETVCACTVQFLSILIASTIGRI